MTPDQMARLMTDLLQVNDQIRLVVYPRACSGLEDFPLDVPLTLNIGHALAPPMNIEVGGAAGLTFRASVRGRCRAVHVPWEGVLFAGNEAAFQETLARAARLQVAARSGAAAGTADNVVRVDLGRR